MSFVPVFEGIVKDGKLFLDNRESFDKYVAGLNGRVMIEVKKWRKQRTLNQNAFYWAVVIEMLAYELGYSQDEAHEAMKWQFLKIEIDGKPSTVRSTHDLTTIEFMEYINKIKEWAFNFLNLIIPDPNEVELT